MVRHQLGNLRSFASLGLRITVVDVDGRLSGDGRLEVLKLSESASTALIYPGYASRPMKKSFKHNGRSFLKMELNHLGSRRRVVPLGHHGRFSAPL